MGADYRQYAPEEVGRDGYPLVWHARIKHEVREAAGNRCVRCGHPYQSKRYGNGEWSPCDACCTHAGPVRYRHDPDERWLTSETMVPSSQYLYDATHTTVNPANPRQAICAGTLRIEARWRILTVHHLDGDKANLRWWNLVALDQRCHLQIQGKVQMARVWPWEHSEWFKPYVAGYYASCYLGEELTRPETEARLEELLALERAA